MSIQEQNFKLFVKGKEEILQKGMQICGVRAEQSLHSL